MYDSRYFTQYSSSFFILRNDIKVGFLYYDQIFLQFVNSLASTYLETEDQQEAFEFSDEEYLVLKA